MLVSVGLNDKKNLEIVSAGNEKKYEVPYGLETPSVEAGYQGIARKAIGNAILFIALPAAGAIGKSINVVTQAIGVVGYTACGAVGLVATPAILAKDLTHHTCRVLNKKFSEIGLLSKKS